MMANLELILWALLLDFVLGDPRSFPHPIVAIGRGARWFERVFVRALGARRFTGVLLACSVIGSVAMTGWVVLFGAARAGPFWADLVAVYMLYSCFAARDLTRHSLRVFKALAGGNLKLARTATGMMVGRDTSLLTETQVVQATVESVAENMVDGVTAPLFYALLGGPIGALVYKAINTLDSTFGYKNEQYLELGWASAKIDDLANLLPARLTAPLIVLAARLLGYRAGDAGRIMRRDARNHASPNSGFTEAATAGALGIQLGGAAFYFGTQVIKPTIGDARLEPQAENIKMVNSLLWVTLGLFTLLFSGITLTLGAI